MGRRVARLPIRLLPAKWLREARAYDAMGELWTCAALRRCRRELLLALRDVPLWPVSRVTRDVMRRESAWLDRQGLYGGRLDNSRDRV